MKNIVFALCFIFCQLAFSMDSVICEKDTVPAPLTVEVAALFENVNGILPLKIFKISVDDLTSGESLTGITDDDGLVYFDDYRPISSHEYTLRIFKGWSDEILCSSKLNSDYLVKRHKEMTGDHGVSSPALSNHSALYFVIDGSHLISDMNECSFAKGKSDFKYKKL